MLKKSRMLSAILAFCLLLSATACGKQTPPRTIEGVKTAIAQGDYELAYTYLLDLEGEEADELLKKFVFVLTSKITEYDDVTVEDRYAYDEMGNFLSDTFIASDGQESTSFLCTYDEEGRLLSSRSAHAGQYVDLVYDAEGCTVRVHQHGDFLSPIIYLYRLDQQNQLVYRCSGDKHPTVTENRDDSGNLLSRHTLFSDGNTMEETATYDAQGRILTYERHDSNGNLQRKTFTYSNTGERLTTYSSVGNETKSATNEYTYDAYGNVLSHHATSTLGEWFKKTYTYDESGRMLTAHQDGYDPLGEGLYYSGSQTYTYDGQGNLLREEGSGILEEPVYLTNAWFIHRGAVGDTYSRVFTYDSYNRLIRAEERIDYAQADAIDTHQFADYSYEKNGHYAVVTTSAGGAPLCKWVYDGQGRRVEEWPVNRDTNELYLYQKRSYDAFGNLAYAYSQKQTDSYTYELKYYPDGFPFAFINTDDGPGLWPNTFSIPDEVKERLYGGELPSGRASDIFASQQN